MDTISMFPLEEFEEETSHMPGDEAAGGAVDVPGQNRIDNQIRVEREQFEDSGQALMEVEVEAEPGSNAPAGAAAGGEEQAGGDEVDPVYESTGLDGPFEWDPLARVFPDLPQGDFDSLVADMEMNGLLEDITIAGNPPKVIDGTQRERACKKAGIRPRYRRLRDDIDPNLYVWAKNAVRRDLTPSQKALTAALLFPSPSRGRPPTQRENCAGLHNYSQITQGEAAEALGISRRLLSDAVKVSALDGPAVPELREAVRQNIVTVSDAAKSKVIGASPQVQLQALARVKDRGERTMAAAVGRVLEEIAERECDQVPRFVIPTRFGDNATIYRCPVAELRTMLEPGTVDLIIAFPAADARPAIFSDLGSLATHALTEAGMMVVGLADTGMLPEVLSRLRKAGPEWIAELSLLFPNPIGNSGEPHWMGLRRVALLVCGKAGARLEGECDVIEVPAPSGGTADRPLELEDGMPLVVQRFASLGQVVCDPLLSGRSGVALAVVETGCAFVGADEDQSSIDVLWEQVNGSLSESPPLEQERSGP